MNIQAVIGLIAAAVVIGGGALYLSSTPPATETPEAATATGDETSGTGTFAELLSRGGSWKCDVAVDVEAAPAEGTAYISGSEVRADIVARPVLLGSREINAHMIQRDGYVYTWTDLLPQGVKMAIGASVGAAATSQGIDPNAPVSYSCDPWTPDASVFAVPETIAFTEFSADGEVFIPTPQ